jgi:hypothetical protein
MNMKTSPIIAGKAHLCRHEKTKRNPNGKDCLLRLEQENSGHAHGIGHPH